MPRHIKLKLPTHLFKMIPQATTAHLEAVYTILRRCAWPRMQGTSSGRYWSDYRFLNQQAVLHFTITIADWHPFVYRFIQLINSQRSNWSNASQFSFQPLRESRSKHKPQRLGKSFWERNQPEGFTQSTNILIGSKHFRRRNEHKYYTSVKLKTAPLRVSQQSRWSVPLRHHRCYYFDQTSRKTSVSYKWSAWTALAQV